MPRSHRVGLDGTTGDRDFTNRLLNGLIDTLAARPLAERELPDGLSMQAFRESGAARLVIPATAGGMGVPSLDAVRVQSALGAVAPSLAVGTMMHHLAVIALTEYLGAHFGDQAPAWALVRAIAANGYLVASASSEARSGHNALIPRAQAVRSGDGFTLTGSKKPCSLSYSMDLVTCTVVFDSDGEQHIGLAVLPASMPGVEVREFWRSPILKGAENEEVVLNDVAVPSAMVLPGGPLHAAMDELGVRTWAWFEILSAATYLGVAADLVQRAAARPEADRRIVGELVTDLFVTRAAIDRAAAEFDRAPAAGDGLAVALMARAAAEARAPEIAMQAVGCLGGGRFATDPDLAYLVAVTRALALHPPRRERSSAALAAWFGGSALDPDIF